jgi:hypothetical protein
MAADKHGFGDWMFKLPGRTLIPFFVRVLGAASTLFKRCGRKPSAGQEKVRPTLQTLGPTVKDSGHVPLHSFRAFIQPTNENLSKCKNELQTKNEFQDTFGSFYMYLIFRSTPVVQRKFHPLIF